MDRRLALMIVVCGTWAALTGCVGRPSPLFNGRDLWGWETYTVETGRANPGAFVVEKGVLKVAGGAGDRAYFGGLISTWKYSNYKLFIEFAYGGPTYGVREGRSRDGGVMVHAQGAVDPKLPWMTGYAVSLGEGSVGDVSIINIPGTAYHLNDRNTPVTLSATVEGREIAPTRYAYAPGAPSQAITGGIKVIEALPLDAPPSVGDVITLEIICFGDSIVCSVNGRVINRIEGINQTSGRIVLQSAGAEILFRRVEITKLAPAPRTPTPLTREPQ